jgi:hypothetical protein
MNILGPFDSVAVQEGGFLRISFGQAASCQYGDWDATDKAGNNFAIRYPITFEWDFSSEEGVPIQRVKVWDTSDNLVLDQYAPNLKITRTANAREDFSGGIYQGWSMIQDISNGSGVIPYYSKLETVALYVPISWAAEKGWPQAASELTFRVKITDGSGFVSENRVRVTIPDFPVTPLCWYWGSNPGEATPTVNIFADLQEDSPGQWDVGGDYTITWWDGSTTVKHVTSVDLGFQLLGSKTRAFTPPMNPPPTEIVTVALTGGDPPVNRSWPGPVQFQQDAVGPFLQGENGCPTIQISGSATCLAGGATPDGAEVRVYYEFPVGNPLWSQDWCAVNNWVVEGPPGVYTYDLYTYPFGCVINIPGGEPFVIHLSCSTFGGTPGTATIPVPAGWPVAGPFTGVNLTLPLCPLI